jgi:hypothetical protein
MTISCDDVRALAQASGARMMVTLETPVECSAKKAMRSLLTGRRRIVCCKMVLGDDAFLLDAARHLTSFIMMAADGPD